MQGDEGDEEETHSDWPHCQGRKILWMIEMSDYGGASDDAGWEGERDPHESLEAATRMILDLCRLMWCLDGLTRLATRSKAVDSNPAKQGLSST
jgi:hypothetical protein